LKLLFPPSVRTPSADFVTDPVPTMTPEKTCAIGKDEPGVVADVADD
jgi:hypothetical protein